MCGKEGLRYRLPPSAGGRDETWELRGLGLCVFLNRIGSCIILQSGDYYIMLMFF